MKDALFAAVLAVSVALITAGVWTFSTGAGLITAGVLTAVYSAVVLGDDGDRNEGGR